MTDNAPAAAPAPSPSPADTATVPGASDLLNVPSTMTMEQAQAKKVELFGRAGFAERVLANDPESVRQWKEVTRGLRPPVDQSTVEGRQYEKNMDSLSILKAKADLTDAAWDQIAARGPVLLSEREKALQAKQRNFRDKAWVQRYFDGDRAANSEMTLINAILGSRVGSPDEIAAFTAAAAKRLNSSR